MLEPTDEQDERLLRLWSEFKANYESLGYRKASYDYFRQWLRSVSSELAENSSEEMQRRLHAYRKRVRLRKKNNRE